MSNRGTQFQELVHNYDIIFFQKLLVKGQLHGLCFIRLNNKKCQQSCQWDERRERPGRILVVALEGHHSVVRLGPLRATVVLFRRRLTTERPAVIFALCDVICCAGRREGPHSA